MTRRELLRNMGSGFGMLGLAQMAAGASTNTVGPLTERPTHFPPRAKRVIFLFLNGGPSHVDTFDPKPALSKYDGKPMPTPNLKTERKTGNLMKSPWNFRRYGQSGIEVSDLFPRLGERADDLCVVRSMYTDLPNHPPAMMQMNTGDRVPGRPALGSWLTYGLGSENQNLPGFLVLCPGSPGPGPQLWSSAFLPAVYQGTHVLTGERQTDKLIQYIRNKEISLPEQRRELDFVNRLNRMQQSADPEMEAAIQSMEIAFRMQTEAPEAFDITKESEATRARYGDGDFGRGCLMALRLIERGVRVVQVYFGAGLPWDSHDDILNHNKLARQADGPAAALIEDLKSRGLFNDTLVLIGGEFGRTPAVETGGEVSVHNGRDHNSYGFTMLLAGGGTKGGLVYGATDEFGFKAVEKPVHVHDLHATILHLLGFDHTRLTYRYSGRDFRLTDVSGEVVKDIIA